MMSYHGNTLCGFFLFVGEVGAILLSAGVGTLSLSLSVLLTQHTTRVFAHMAAPKQKQDTSSTLVRAYAIDTIV